ASPCAASSCRSRRIVSSETLSPATSSATATRPSRSSRARISCLRSAASIDAGYSRIVPVFAGQRPGDRGSLIPRAVIADPVKVELASGSGAPALELPAGRTTVVRPAHRAPAADPLGAVRQALRTPLAGPPLRELVARGQKVAISVCDGTR